MTEPNSEILMQQYLAAIQSREVTLDRIKDLGSDNQPVFNVAGLGYILVTLSMEFPGLWKLDQILVSTMKARALDAGVSCWFPLLIARRDGRGANGYILSDFESSPIKREVDYDDGQMIIREKRHLDSLRLVLSTDKQADLLLRKRI